MAARKNSRKNWLNILQRFGASEEVLAGNVHDAPPYVNCYVLCCCHITAKRLEPREKYMAHYKEKLLLSPRFSTAKWNMMTMAEWRSGRVKGKMGAGCKVPLEKSARLLLLQPHKLSHTHTNRVTTSISSERIFFNADAEILLKLNWQFFPTCPRCDVH